MQSTNNVHLESCFWARGKCKSSIHAYVALSHQLQLEISGSLAELNAPEYHAPASF